MNVFNVHFFYTYHNFRVFRTTMTYKHYNNPDNDRSNTFVLNILLIIDTFKEINPLVNETRHTNRILQVLNRAAKALNELSNPKIKLHISGVVKLKQINHSNLKVFKETQFAYYECYDIHLTYNAMSKWLFDDSATFGEIDYDMFVFAPNADLCIKNGGQLDSRSYYLPKNKDCTNTDDSSHPSGGLLDFDNENAELHIVQMIAENVQIFSTYRKHRKCLYGKNPVIILMQAYTT
ncbi:uncharacterized protein LOC130677410 isoform X2 [Microplitis mediator]|uniref:uncharacterized protein LOC130677410 isoform X2 n=1 Tax=Microplitis mediator TaxID=375433 RepID=UPI00255342C6|nr:uncharacterized protein LOC130677410 isoform X2 [Microplitis mediator]